MTTIQLYETTFAETLLEKECPEAVYELDRLLEPTQIIELSDSVFHRGIELERVFVKEGVKDLKLPKTISSGSDVERARCLLSTIGQDLEENGYVQKSSLKNEKNFAVVPNICRPTAFGPVTSVPCGAVKPCVTANFKPMVMKSMPDASLGNQGMSTDMGGGMDVPTDATTTNGILGLTRSAALDLLQKGKDLVKADWAKFKSLPIKNIIAGVGKAFAIGAALGWIEGMLTELVPKRYRTLVVWAFRIIGASSLVLSIVFMGGAPCIIMLLINIAAGLIGSLLGHWFGRWCGRKLRSLIGLKDTPEIPATEATPAEPEVPIPPVVVPTVPTYVPPVFMTHVCGTEGYLSTGTCILCCENAANTVFFPCGHMTYCGQCTRKGFKSCPICREEIEEAYIIPINQQNYECPNCVYVGQCRDCNLNVGLLTIVNEDQRRFQLRACTSAHERSDLKTIPLIGYGMLE